MPSTPENKTVVNGSLLANSVLADEVNASAVNDITEEELNDATEGLTGNIQGQLNALSNRMNTPPAINQVNGIRVLSTSVGDNGGKCKLMLMYDITDWWNLASGAHLDSICRGFTGHVYAARLGGYAHQIICELIIRVSYDKSSCNLQTSNDHFRPKIVHRTTDDTYHLALEIPGLSMSIRFHGLFQDFGKWEGQVLNYSGDNMPSGYEAVDKQYTFISVNRNCLPKATSSAIGAVKPDNSTTTVDANGVASAHWGNGIAISASTDLNTLTSPGIYRGGSNAIAGTLKNCPTGYAFSMIVYGMNPPNSVYQEITEFMTSGARKWFRNKYKDASVDAWGEWVPICTGVSGLPIASETKLGGVKPDGETLEVDPKTGVMKVIGGVSSGAVLTNTPSDVVGAMWYEE